MAFTRQTHLNDLYGVILILHCFAMSFVFFLSLYNGKSTEHENFSAVK